MAVGLDQDTESLQRGSIPSGGAGTLSDGGFTNCFVGVWLYRPSSGNSYGLTAEGSIIHFQAGAREVKLGFDNTFGSGTASDPLLQVIFNSGGGSGATQTFSGANFFDEWVYYFIAENPTDGQIAGYIRLSNLSSATTITRTNDNAGSQYINTLTFGNASGNTTGVLGRYAYARAAYNTSGGYNTTDALAFAASTAPGSGMWGFWPLADNTDNVDDSGNSRDLTFNGTLTSESDPPFGVEIALTGVSATGQVGTVERAFGSSTSFQSLGFQSNAFAILGGTVGGGGPDVTLSLTGVSAAGQLGTLASAISYALSGNQATGQVGNVGDAISYALTGAGAAGQVGSVGDSISYTLSGNQATGAVGTVSYASDITLALTGASATGAVGSVVPAVSYALSGVNATGNVGAVVANVTYALSGASATGQVGNVSAGNDVVISLTGIQATGAIGSVVSALSYSLTGVSGSGQVGSVTAAPSYTLSGNQATGSVGSVGDAISYALTGVAATGDVGSVAVPGDVTRALTGVSATGQVGNVSAQSGTDFSGGWWMPPRRKKKQPEPEVVEQAIEAVEEEPQTALADALRTAAAKAANQAQKGAEDALVQFVKELEARRAADEAQRLANEAWLADLARAEAEMRRRREDEETALLFILTARKRKSRQPA